MSEPALPPMMTAVEVAHALGISRKRVSEVLPPTVRLSPRRTRWAREAVEAVMRGKPVPSDTRGSLMRHLGRGPLDDAAVAKFFRCPVSVVPYLSLALDEYGHHAPHEIDEFLRTHMP